MTDSNGVLCTYAWVQADIVCTVLHYGVLSWTDWEDPKPIFTSFLSSLWFNIINLGALKVLQIAQDNNTTACFIIT